MPEFGELTSPMPAARLKERFLLPWFNFPISIALLSG